MTTTHSVVRVDTCVWCVSVSVCVHFFMCACDCACARACVCVCLSVYELVCIHICVYMCVSFMPPLLRAHIIVQINPALSLAGDALSFLSLAF